MVLQFKFKYLSNNGTLLRFLESCAQMFPCEYKILKDNDFITLYVKAEDEILELFANKLSSYLPMSIYFWDSSIEACENLPFGQSLKIKDDFVLPFCVTCLNDVEDEENSNYYNAFHSCSNCGSELDDKEFNLINKKETSEKSYKSSNELFKKLALLINEDKKIKIKTFSGTFIFSKITKIKEDTKILINNINNVSSMFVISNQELVALTSIEKPFINLRINEIYKMKDNCSVNSLDTRFVNDFILYFLSKELSDLNIDFLEYDESNDNSEYDYSLDFESKDFKLIDIPKIKILNKKTMLLESSSYPENLNTIYNTFDDKNKGQFMVLLKENVLEEKSIINFYFSSKYANNISVYSKVFDGFIDVVNIKIPNNMQEVFELIQKDEAGKKLVNNYKKAFPSVYEKALNTDISAFAKNNTFSSLFSIAKIILDFKNDIISNANEALLEKGPRIDYKFLKSEKFYNKELDLARFFRSAMSFKLAGVDENTISLGYIESLAHFIGTLVDSINSEFDLDGVSLNGDMFENELFSKIVHKSITRNFNIYYNKDFVLQGL